MKRSITRIGGTSDLSKIIIPVSLYAAAFIQQQPYEKTYVLHKSFIILHSAAFMVKPYILYGNTYII